MGWLRCWCWLVHGGKHLKDLLVIGLNHVLHAFDFGLH